VPSWNGDIGLIPKTGGLYDASGEGDAEQAAAPDPAGMKRYRGT
jgi:hypothetical protein